MVARHDLTAAQHQLFAEGFRLKYVNGYTVNRQDRYASIWEKGTGPAMIARHNLSSAQHQQTVEQLFREGFRPICVSGYSVNGQDRYASIWVQSTGPAMVARHNLTAAQHQQTVKELFARGFRPTCVNGYSVNGQDRYASIWEKKGGPALETRHTLNSTQYQQTFDQLLSEGFCPLQVSGYGTHS